MEKMLKEIIPKNIYEKEDYLIKNDIQDGIEEILENF